MPYFTITDFAGGLDLRRNALTAPAGTLRSMVNCHVTPGGEIEKRYAFVPIKTLPANSRGLIERDRKLYTCLPDPGTRAADTQPAHLWDVGEHYLSGIGVLNEIIDWDLFENQFFVIASDTGGTVYHFYGNVDDGANRVTDENCHGFFTRAYKQKMYNVGGSSLFFSVPFDPKTWTNNVDPDADPQGAGSIDLSANDSDMVDCMAIEVYFDKLAIMSKTATQLWQIDPDPLMNQAMQTIRGAGTIAYKSVLGYGSGDVLFLAPDGIRSLRARNSSLAASTADIGSPLDPVIQEIFRVSGELWLSRAMSILQPVTGRFWMIFPDRIYVLSAFPGPKITAWSEYWPTDMSGNAITITDACIHANTVCVRATDNVVYAYGGPSHDAVGTPLPQNVFDSSPVELIFPYHGGDNPATDKAFNGIDATCTGEWDVYTALNPENDDAEDYVGKLLGSSFNQGRLPMIGTGTHMSLRLRATRPGPLTMSNMIVHYQVGEAD
jgi:hypothetical protein